MKIYLDVCCLNRPFDDQSQDRVRLEAEAVEIILRHVQDGDYDWVGSDVVEYELMQIQAPDRRRRILELVEYANESVAPDEDDFGRSRQLHGRGFKEIDSLHIACAEKSACEALLTTDDRMLRAAERNKDVLQVRVMNPLTWLSEVSPT